MNYSFISLTCVTVGSRLSLLATTAVFSAKPLWAGAPARNAAPSAAAVFRAAFRGAIGSYGAWCRAYALPIYTAPPAVAIPRAGLPRAVRSSEPRVALAAPGYAAAPVVAVPRTGGGVVVGTVQSCETGVALAAPVHAPALVAAVPGTDLLRAIWTSKPSVALAFSIMAVAPAAAVIRTVWCRHAAVWSIEAREARADTVHAAALVAAVTRTLGHFRRLGGASDTWWFTDT